MAKKRMFNNDVLDTDAFLDMPLSAQALYFHLNLRADDDGFISNPKRIQAYIGASDDDLKLLVLKRFILTFEDGVIVIKHWRMHNTIQKDRYHPTLYQEDLKMLGIKENKAYTLDVSNLDTKCIQNDSRDLDIGLDIDIDIDIDKDLDLEKKKSKKENTLALIERLSTSYSFSENALTMIQSWAQYKMERKEEYKEQGAKSLLTQISKKIELYGEDSVLDLIDECMSNNWKGIIWDKLAKKENKSSRSGAINWDEV